MRYLIIEVALFLMVFSVIPAFAQDGFTQKDRELLQKDRELLIELKVKVGEIDKRLDQMIHFLYILAGIFTSLVVAVIGFAYWDRRTIIREARREAIEFMEKEGTLRRLLDALRELSQKDSKLAEALKRFNLL